MMLMKEFHRLPNRLIRQLLNTIRKSSKNASEDLLVELLLSKSVVHQKLRLESLKTEFRMLFAQLVLPLTKVLYQAVVQHFSLPAKNLMNLREITLIKMLVSRL